MTTSGLAAKYYWDTLSETYFDNSYAVQLPRLMNRLIEVGKS